MTQMNVLQIVDEACGRLTQSQPGSVVGSSDKNVLQFLALLNEEGRALRKRYPWTVVTLEGSFTTLAAESQGALNGTIVSSAYDVDYILNDVMWNRSALLPICGPSTSKSWQARKALGINGLYGEYRLRGGNLIIQPTPTAGDSVYFEYVSRNWLQNVAGDTFYSRVTADTQIPLLNDEAITLGLKWRWLKAKGLEYAEDFNTYEAYVADLMARDGTKPIINSNQRSRAYPVGVVIPPGSWPVY